MKYCPKCKTNHALTEFFKNAHTKDGYARVCKKCAADYQRHDRTRLTDVEFNDPFLRVNQKWLCTKLPVQGNQVTRWNNISASA